MDQRPRYLFLEASGTVCVARELAHTHAGRRFGDQERVVRFWPETSATVTTVRLDYY